MRKIWSVIFILLFLFMTGCRTQTEVKDKRTVVKEEFMVNSFKWGSSWEKIKSEPQMKEYNIIRDDGNRFVVEINNFEYLEQKGKLILLFSNSESSFPASGLIQAYFAYDDDIEKTLIEKSEEVYGERKDFFLDKKGIENPLNPPAWYCEETLEKSLNEKEKEEYLKKYEGKGYDETRIDALLRGPLVIITVDEEKNVIRFQGNDAAVVENLRK